MLSVIKVRLAFLSQESMCLKSYTSCTHQLLHATLAELLSTHTNSTHIIDINFGIVELLGNIFELRPMLRHGATSKGWSLPEGARTDRAKGERSRADGWRMGGALNTANSSPKICQSKCKSLRNLHFEHLLQLNDDADALLRLCLLLLLLFLLLATRELWRQFWQLPSSGPRLPPNRPASGTCVCECVYYGIVQLVLSSRAHKSFPCYPT